MGKKKIKKVEVSKMTEDGGINIPMPKKRKVARQITKAIVNICATYNNTIISLADEKGNVIAQSSSGRLGFRGAKKSTPFAAMKVVQHISALAQPYQVKEVDVKVKGIGSGREAAIRALGARNFNVLSIRDITPVPHNGCRPPKRRRV